MTTFEQLQLIPRLLDALKNEGYTTPTPIQEQAIPVILGGKDLFGIAQTGTGKTAAFALPILQLLEEQEGTSGHRSIKALICTPTRELAIQIGESFATYGRYCHLRQSIIYGGVNQNPQITALRRGVDILIVTPGRLLDLMQQGHVHLQHIEIFVLDEGDRMLDMGFIHDIRRIITKLPVKRQNLFFSATLPPDILRLANDILRQPVRVEVTPQSSTVDTIEQSVFFVDKASKRQLLIHLLKDNRLYSVLVFSRTKHGADKITKELQRVGVEAQAIHGDKSQNARQRALTSFKQGKCRVLVATDIAARGIDIDDLTHVINFDLPEVAETYVHRVGRTGRAGASGVAFSFCCQEETGYLRDIHRLIQKELPVVTEHPFAMPYSTATTLPRLEDTGRKTTNSPFHDRHKRRTFTQEKTYRNR
ncbi:MAG: DEAD/DEAH box helicase [Candidatus Margulisiibacteriota bacterium]